MRGWAVITVGRRIFMMNIASERAATITVLQLKLNNGIKVTGDLKAIQSDFTKRF